MKIHKQLLINNQAVTLTDCTIRLDLFTAGRAVISCTGMPSEKGQLVEFNAALGDAEKRRVFLGYVESVTETKSGVYQLIARELAAILNQRIALDCRHVTPAQVLTAISEQTGQEFVLPEQPWCEQTIARFQHIGGGYGALDALLTLWNVSKGVWLQQSDGRVYVGEVTHSVPGARTITLDAKLFQSHSVTGGTLPLVPRFRPGVHINILGQVWVVTSLDITGDTMRLHWSENPWSKHLKAVS